MLLSSAPSPPSSSLDNVAGTVAAVVTTFNDAEFLSEALSSLIAQQRPADEIILVDDGSDNSPANVLADFPEVRLLSKANGGLSSARNAGLYNARSSYILFLDADDKLRSNAIVTGLGCFSRSPRAAMVYGGHRRIRGDGTALGNDRFEAVGADPYASLLTGNRIGMHATVLYRRDVLLALGGFDETLRRCEDYDVYLRVARQYPIASHSDIVAEYRWHGTNMSADPEEMLRAVLEVHNRYKERTLGYCRAWRAGRRNWKAYYRAETASRRNCT